MITGIDHIAIAVENLEPHIRFYRDVLGLSCQGIEEIPDQKVRVAVFAAGGVRLELLEPMRPDSPISQFLEKRGGGLHHVAFSVENIVRALREHRVPVEAVVRALREVAEKNVALIDRQPRTGEGGKRIAFLHPKTTGGVLIEFCEKPSG